MKHLLCSLLVLAFLPLWAQSPESVVSNTPSVATDIKAADATSLNPSKEEDVERTDSHKDDGGGPSASEQDKDVKEVEKSFPILFKEKVVFRLPYNDENHDQASSKAKEASASLEKALSAELPLSEDAETVSVKLTNKNIVEVLVRGYKVFELNTMDQKASPYETMEEYYNFTSRELNSVIPQMVERIKFQKLALRFFLSVFFGLMGFVVFRRVIVLFNQADRLIEIKKETFRPMTFLSETLISGQTLGGLLASLLVFGRMITYLIVILTTAAAIFGQFQATRDMMSTFFGELISGAFKIVQSFFESIPGLLLAFLLLFTFQVSVKFLHLYLKGVRSGRISWRFLQENRIPVVNFWGPLLLVAFFFPLAVASAFGRFNTPIETILVVLASVLVVSQIPVWSSIAVGSFLIWQGQVRVGMWLKCGKNQGEVTEVSLHKITLVPMEGGRIHVPMFHLLFYSFTDSREIPTKKLELQVKRQQGLEETMELVRDLMPAAFSPHVLCRGIGPEIFTLELQYNIHSDSDRQQVFALLAKAQAEHKIEWTGFGVQEIQS